MSKHIKHYKRFYEWYDEDLWGRLSIATKNSKSLEYLYKSFQADAKKRMLGRKRMYLSNKDNFFRFSKKNDNKFLYQLDGTDQEFKKKKRRFIGKKRLTILKLKAFYGNIRLKSLKSLLNLKSKNPRIWSGTKVFLLENRLDIFLHRTNFFPTIFFVKQFIKHQGVLVNGFRVANPNFQIKVSDIITIPGGFYYEFLNYFIAKLNENRVLRNLPSYVEANYRIGSFMVLRLPRGNEISYPFRAKAGGFSIK